MLRYLTPVGFLQVKTFKDFARKETAEVLALRLVKHETHTNPWMKDLVFMHTEMTEFCKLKRIYCKHLVLEISKKSEMCSPMISPTSVASVCVIFLYFRVL